MIHVASTASILFVRPARHAALLAGLLAATAAQAQLVLPYSSATGSASDAFKVTNSGNGRALAGYTTSSSGTGSAVLGVTSGGGAGLTGISNGNNGPAGKFEVQSATNGQPGVTVKTTGTGPGGKIEIANTSNAQPGLTITHSGRGSGLSSIVQREPGLGVDSAAVLGRNNNVSGYGYGGDFRGGFVGLYAAALNGYGIYATAPASSGYAGYFSGNVYIAGNLTYTSDREQKTDARGIDGAEVLDRLARLPVESWAFTGQPEVRHVGPYAQDFRAAFGLGNDDRSISPVDVSGVTLVAVQELNRRLARQDDEIRALKAQMAEMAAARR